MANATYRLNAVIHNQDSDPNHGPLTHESPIRPQHVGIALNKDNCLLSRLIGFRKSAFFGRITVSSRSDNSRWLPGE